LSWTIALQVCARGLVLGFRYPSNALLGQRTESNETAQSSHSYCGYAARWPDIQNHHLIHGWYGGCTEWCCEDKCNRTPACRAYTWKPAGGGVCRMYHNFRPVPVDVNKVSHQHDLIVRLTSQSWSCQALRCAQDEVGILSTTTSEVECHKVTVVSGWRMVEQVASGINITVTYGTSETTITDAARTVTDRSLTVVAASFEFKGFSSSVENTQESVKSTYNREFGSKPYDFQRSYTKSWTPEEGGYLWQFYWDVYAGGQKYITRTSENEVVQSDLKPRCAPGEGADREHVNCIGCLLSLNIKCNPFTRNCATSRNASCNRDPFLCECSLDACAKDGRCIGYL